MPQQIDFDPSVDYYKALGVPQGATADEIKKAYRKLAKANHPDSTGGDKAKETRFKTISSAYDVLGDSKKRGMYDQIRANGGGMPGMGGATYTQHGAGPNVFDLGDLFGQFFSQAGSQPGSTPGRGGPRRQAPSQQTHDAEFEQKIKASDGSYLRVEANDVHSDVRITFDRAILGTVAAVATIDGKAEVKIPPGSSSGRRLRLRGKGVADRTGRIGDHYITVQLDVPGELDDEQQKLLAQFVAQLKKKPDRKPG